MLGAFTRKADAEYYSGDDYTFEVYYDGKELSMSDSDLKKLKDLDDALADFQPGDSILLTFDIVNRSTNKTVDWYMRNDSESFEDGDKTLGAIYTYILSYGSKEFYNSDIVGGEDEGTDGPSGIETATIDLENYFILDRLAPGDNGTVTIYLKVDGETQIDVYQEKLSSLIAQFAIEVVPDPEHKEEHKEKIIYIPYTGDDTDFSYYMIAELIALLLMAAVVYAYYRYRQKQEGAR